MTGSIAMGPLLVLALVIGAGLLMVMLSGGQRRRRSGLVVAAVIILLLAVLGSSLFLVRTTQTRAMAEHERAVAMREAALQREMHLRKSIEAAGYGASISVSPAESGDGDHEDIVDDWDPQYSASAVDGINSRTGSDGDADTSKIQAASEVVIGNSKTQVRQVFPPTPPQAPHVEYHYVRPESADRTTRTQILTGILLAGVVLAGYFFLNANTRGHYTWQLRIGSTLVFVASVVVIFVITSRF